MEKTMKWIAAAAGAAAGLLTRMPMALRLLVLLMALDYLSGVGVALLGKSPKSEGGALSSRAGFAGLARKAMIFGDRPSGPPCSISSRGARPARRGDDVLYRQRIAFDFGKRGAARRTRAAAAAAGARRGAARRRQREGKNQGRLNVAGCGGRRIPRPPRAGNFFQRKG